VKRSRYEIKLTANSCIALCSSKNAVSLHPAHASRSPKSNSASENELAIEIGVSKAASGLAILHPFQANFALPKP
jgi:hypothetical protein